MILTVREKSFVIYSLKILLITMDKKTQKDPRTKVKKEKAELRLL